MFKIYNNEKVNHNLIPGAVHKFSLLRKLYKLLKTFEEGNNGKAICDLGEFTYHLFLKKKYFIIFLRIYFCKNFFKIF